MGRLCKPCRTVCTWFWVRILFTLFFECIHDGLYESESSPMRMSWYILVCTFMIMLYFCLCKNIQVCTSIYWSVPVQLFHGQHVLVHTGIYQYRHVHIWYNLVKLDGCIPCCKRVHTTMYLSGIACYSTSRLISSYPSIVQVYRILREILIYHKPP